MSTSPVLSLLIPIIRHYSIVQAKTRSHNVACGFHSYALSKEAIFNGQNTRVVNRI